MFGSHGLVTAAFVLPLFGVYFFLFFRLLGSTDAEQRQILTGPRWMAAVNTLTMIGTFFVLSKIETQHGRLIAAAASSVLWGTEYALRLRYLRRRGLNPSLLSRLRRLDLLAALAIALTLIAYALSGT